MAERSIDDREQQNETPLAELETVYDRYAGIALSLATRLVRDERAAEEIVRDSFLALWNHKVSHRWGHAEMRSWLIRHVRQRSADHMRTRSTPPTAPETGGVSGPPHGFRSMRGAEVRAALARLPPDQRQAIELAFFDGFTYREIADQLGQPVEAVLTHLRLGLHAITPYVSASSEQEDS